LRTKKNIAGLVKQENNLEMAKLDGILKENQNAMIMLEI